MTHYTSYGFTTYQFDVLGQLTKQVNADGTTSKGWQYNGNAVTFTDENLNQSTRVSDVLGNLIQVTEPGQLVTQYNYDPLGNLLSVNQLGNTAAGDVPRKRSFSYDSLSRLLCASNPENSSASCPSTASGSYFSGTTGYSYDLNGNMATKTSPAVNVSSGSRTIAFCYDALNRVTYKFLGNPSSCPTPASYLAAYTYDGTGLADAQNAIGQLTDAKSFAGGTLVSERQPFSYDAMGRLLAERQFTYSNLPNGTPYTLTYQHDSLGHVVQMTNPVGANGAPLTLDSSFDSAGRICLLTSSWSAGFSPNLFQVTPGGSGSGAGYSASGALQNWSLGSNSASPSLSCDSAPVSTINVQQLLDKRLRVTSFSATGQVP